MIKFCPNCAGTLQENKATGQHVKECPDCLGRYFVIETTSPKVDKLTELIKARNEIAAAE